MNQNESTERYFDRIASGTEAKAWAGNVDKWDVIEPLFDNAPADAKVLECGAGTGMYTVRMLRQGWHVTAVDLSEEALRVNRRIAETHGVGKNLTTVRGTFEEAARKAGQTFDIVAYFKTLHHFPDLSSVRDAIVHGYEAVRPAGMLVGLEPNGDCPLWRPGLLMEGIHPRGGKPVWEMEKGLLMITQRNLSRIFRQLPCARWEFRWEYLIPACLGRRIPRTARLLNRLLCRTPLKRWAFNLTFRVWKGSP